MSKTNSKKRRFNKIMSYVWFGYFYLISAYWGGMLVHDVMRHKGTGEYILDGVMIALFFAITMLIFSIEKNSAVMDNDLDWFKHEHELIKNVNEMVDKLIKDTDALVAEAEQRGYAKGVEAAKGKRVVNKVTKKEKK